MTQEERGRAGCRHFGELLARLHRYARALLMTTALGITCSRSPVIHTPDIEWVRVFPGLGWSCGAWVEQASDGGFIVVGRTHSVRDLSPDEQTLPGWPSTEVGGDMCFVVRTDSAGNVWWAERYPSIDGEAVSVRAMPGTGYLVAGTDMNRLWLARVDSQGELLWQRRVWPDSVYTTRSATPGVGSGFVATLCFDGTHSYVVHVDSLGQEEWAYPYWRWTDGNGWTTYSSLAALPTGGCVAFLGTNRLVRLDGSGKPVWNKASPDAPRFFGFAAAATPDGGCVLAGGNLPEHKELDAGLLRCDARGKVEWCRSFGGAFSDAGLAVQAVPGGYVLAGVQGMDSTGDNYKALVIRTDAKGRSLWEKTFGTPGHYNDARSIRRTLDGGYVVTGEIADSATGVLQMYLLNLTTDAVPTRKCRP